MPTENNTIVTMRAEDHNSMLTLAHDSFQIVMKAINHAKLKGHSQVQPLHVAAALLDPLNRSIALHNACLQSLKEPAHPLKCDALDLCFKVALERLPVIIDPEKCRDQAMSNALAAALKRAHANERRGTPEQSLQPLLAVKTGTAHLTISILDDPSVSRVFKEAGFLSTDVKTNMEDAVAQAALVVPPILPSPSLDGAGTRRVQMPMSPFCSPLQFRNSFLPAPLAFAAMDPSNNHGSRLVERGRVINNNVLDVQPERGSTYLGGGISSRQDRDGTGTAAHAFSSITPQFLESALQQQKRQELQQSRMFGRLTGNSPLRGGTSRHEDEVRKIVETLLSGPKSRNPVLVTDSGLNSVVKEFSQRLMSGDVPLLRGVQFLDLPFTSLSMGILSQEAVEQKLAKLKRDVDGCMQGGGAIIVVGDLQWLLEPSHSISSLVLQELQELITSNAQNRLWLLASASPTTFERYQRSRHPSLENLGLQPVQLKEDSSGSALQPSYQSNKNVEMPFLNQVGGGMAPTEKHPGIEIGLEKSDCCPDCSRELQRECSVLMKEEQTLSLRTGPAPDSGSRLSATKSHPQLPWLQNEKDNSWAPLPVKEEETPVAQRIQELRQKWQQNCSTHHHLNNGGRTAGSPGSFRDHSSSPVAEVVSPLERNPRTMHPLLSPSAPSKWAPQPVKPLSARSGGLAPHHARIATGNMPNFLSGLKPAVGSSLREAEAVKRSDASGVHPLSWMRKDPSFPAGAAANTKLSIPIGRSSHPAALSIGTDLALGRGSLKASASPMAHNRDLKEQGQGQHPLHIRAELSSNPKPFKSMPHSAMIRPSDAEMLSGLCWNLSNSVAWQKEAVGAVAATVAKCRSGDGRKTGAYVRTDTWLMFLGPDRVGKREVAKALAKLVFGREENLILVTGWPSETPGHPTIPSTGILAADSNGVKYRGKTPLDRLTEAVARKPFSVVLLEDVDRADFVLKKNLLRAMERGKLPDSSGREVSFANVIVIMTCGVGAGFLTRHQNTSGQIPINFDEEKLSKLGPREVRLVIDNTISENVLHTKGSGLSVVDCVVPEKHERGPAEAILPFGSLVFKRKADSITPGGDSCSTHTALQKRCKREEVSPSRAFSLDLNLPVEENLSEEEEEPCITDELCETSEPESPEDLAAKVIDCARGKLSREMFALLNATVVFKPFNLSGLTDWVVEKVDSALEDVMHSTKAPVEIDRALLEVMVSSAWQNFSNPDDFQGWVDNVLMKAVSGVLENVSLQPDSVVRLMGIERNLVMIPEFANSSSSLNMRVELLPRAIEVGQ